MTEPRVHDAAESSDAQEFPTQSEIEARAAKVSLLLLDCDGVLTDGRITLIGEADEQKSFHTRDGHGLVMLHRAGLRRGKARPSV